MMSDARLRAKATGGRLKGYSVLHMACNGSDRAFQRASLVELLIERGLDLETKNGKGLTPWLLATGSGVVDVAQALSNGGCDVEAVDQNGKNAADRCPGSSSQMSRYSLWYANCT